MNRTLHIPGHTMGMIPGAENATSQIHFERILEIKGPTVRNIQTAAMTEVFPAKPPSASSTTADHGDNRYDPQLLGGYKELPAH